MAKKLNSKKFSFLDGEMRFYKRGFTVIEMLVVISVIAILASIILPALNSAQKKAKITKTQSMIDSITTAFKQYRTDFGAYPLDDTIPNVSGGSPTSAECIYYYSAASFVAGENADEITAGPYMEYRQKDEGTSTQSADMDGDGASDDSIFPVVDAWGNSLIYIEPGTHNTNSFDIYSYGPDGADDSGGDDDIVNW
ncbi:MAG: type II secretion system protein GspG [Chlamydiae bacterium]|nr:type II secretion system protein GspG [Chlamydiota bacterium]MBI3267033.1 type II secretion system protein GspG [Chlamydiota bacterium]